MRYREVVYVLLASVLAAGMWVYVRTVLIPCQVAEAVRTNAPRGNLSDLYPRWLGTREWLLHGRDPYSAEVTRDIQSGYFGRPLNSHNPRDPKDEVRFAYPAYVAFLLAPTVWLPFSTVQILFVTLLASGTAASVLLWANVLGLKLGRAEMLGAAIVALGSWPVVQGLLLQQLSLLVAALLAAFAAALASRRLVLAGALLAIATVKPQLVMPMAAWLSIWIVGNWRDRWRLGGSFLTVLGCLFGGAQWAMPGWFSRWWDGLRAYAEYAQAVPLFSTLFGPVVGQVLRLGVITIVAVACWRNRREEAGSPRSGLMLLVSTVSGLLVMPKWATYDQVLLLPVALWLVAHWRSFAGPARMARDFCAVMIGWQWGAALVVCLLSLVSFQAAARLRALPVMPTLGLPAACLFAICAQSWGTSRKRTRFGAFSGDLRRGGCQ